MARRADAHWTKPQPGERRRRYVVTATRQDGESVEDTDRRVCELLGVEPTGTAITVSVYDPATNDFRDLR
jgi:hypothetical protein